MATAFRVLKAYRCAICQMGFPAFVDCVNHVKETHPPSCVKLANAGTSVAVTPATLQQPSPSLTAERATASEVSAEKAAGSLPTSGLVSQNQNEAKLLPPSLELEAHVPERNLSNKSRAAARTQTLDPSTIAEGQIAETIATTSNQIQGAATPMLDQLKQQAHTQILRCLLTEKSASKKSLPDVAASSTDVAASSTDVAEEKTDQCSEELPDDKPSNVVLKSARANTSTEKFVPVAGKGGLSDAKEVPEGGTETSILVQTDSFGTVRLDPKLLATCAKSAGRSKRVNATEILHLARDIIMAKWDPDKGALTDRGQEETSLAQKDAEESISIVEGGVKRLGLVLSRTRFTQLGVPKPKDPSDKDADSETKPHACPVCSHRYRFLSSLSVHKKRHIGKQPYECKTCQKKFWDRNNLQCHERTHVLPKLYRCGDCGQGFNQLRDLKIHSRIHSGEMPLKCTADSCEKSFRHPSSLQRHANLHARVTAVKPHLKCDQCERRFHHISSLERHYMLHTGQRPYVCHICPAAFARTDTLRLHQRQHNGEKPFVCSVCEKRFADRSHCRRHIQNHKMSSAFIWTDQKLSVVKKEPQDTNMLKETDLEYMKEEDCDEFETYDHSENIVGQEKGTAETRMHKLLIPDCNQSQSKTLMELEIPERSIQASGEIIYHCENFLIKVIGSVPENEAGVLIKTLSETDPAQTSACGAVPWPPPSGDKSQGTHNSDFFLQTIPLQNPEPRGAQCSPQPTGSLSYPLTQQDQESSPEGIRQHSAGALLARNVCRPKAQQKIHGSQQLTAKRNRDEQNKDLEKSGTLQSWVVGDHSNIIIDSSESKDSMHITRGKKLKTGMKKWKCSDCDAAFIHHSELQRHCIVHSGECPYQCPHCSRRIRDPSNLKRHLRTHTGERPYQCNVCEKRFVQAGHLTAHLRIHTGLRPYKCDQCEATFVESNHLRYHKDKHEGNKAHICDTCHMAFYRRTELRRHMGTHCRGLQRPYSCSLCPAAYYRKDVLKVHMDTQHKDKQKCTMVLYEEAAVSAKGVQSTCSECQDVFFNVRHLQDHMTKMGHHSGGRAAADASDRPQDLLPNPETARGETELPAEATVELQPDRMAARVLCELSSQGNEGGSHGRDGVSDIRKSAAEGPGIVGIRVKEPAFAGCLASERSRDSVRGVVTVGSSNLCSSTAVQSLPISRAQLIIPVSVVVSSSPFINSSASSSKVFVSSPALAQRKTVSLVSGTLLPQRVSVSKVKVSSAKALSDSPSTANTTHSGALQKPVVLLVATGSAAVSVANSQSDESSLQAELETVENREVVFSPARPACVKGSVVVLTHSPKQSITAGVGGLTPRIRAMDCSIDGHQNVYTKTPKSAAVIAKTLHISQSVSSSKMQPLKIAVRQTVPLVSCTVSKSNQNQNKDSSDEAIKSETAVSEMDYNEENCNHVVVHSSPPIGVQACPSDGPFPPCSTRRARNRTAKADTRNFASEGTLHSGLRGPAELESVPPITPAGFSDKAIGRAMDLGPERVVGMLVKQELATAEEDWSSSSFISPLCLQRTRSGRIRKVKVQLDL